MTTDLRKVLQRIIKELQSISGSGSGGGGGGATEATLQTLLTVVSKEAKQDTANTSLANIEALLGSMKDGEFRLYTDPLDNDRYVAISADMTDPANPTYLYKYLDDNSNYTGDVNDLELIPSNTQQSIIQLLSQIRDLATKRDITYYVEWEDKLPLDVTSDFEFTYKDNDGFFVAFSDGSALSGNPNNPFSTLGDLVTAINSLPGIPFEFYEIDTNLLYKEGIFNTVIGIRSSSFAIPGQFVSIDTFQLDNIDANGDLQELYPCESDNDFVARGILELQNKIQAQDLLLNTIITRLTTAYEGAELNITSSGADPFPGFPITVTGVTVTFPNSYVEQVDLSPQESTTVQNSNDLAALLDEHLQSLNFEHWNLVGDSRPNSLIIKNGDKLVSELVQLDLALANSGGLDMEYTVFSLFTNQADSELFNIKKLLDDIKNNTDKDKYVNWEFRPDTITTYQYYTGVVAGNPSGNTNNIHKIIYATTPTNIVLVQTFSYDINDKVISQQTSKS